MAENRGNSIANDRKPKIPFEVINGDGNLLTSKMQVIDKWKRDYEKLYNEANESQNFDSNRLHNVKELLENNGDDNSVFPKANCSPLNMPITRDEVRKSIYKMKNGKASGIDEIDRSIEK